MIKLLLIVSLSTPALSQFMQADLQPDIAFGDNNDRFDLTGVFPEQGAARHEDNEEDDDYRRSLYKYLNQHRRSDANHYQRSLWSPPVYSSYRRSRVWPPGMLPSLALDSYRRNQMWPITGNRRSNWLSELADDAGNSNEEVFNRAQEFRRRHHQSRKARRAQNQAKKKEEAKEAKQVKQRTGFDTPEEKEIILQYPVQVKIKVQEVANGTIITGINLLKYVPVFVNPI